MSKEERIQEIRERASKAPKGPWVAFPKSKYGEWHVGIPASNSTMKVALCPDGVPGDDDAERSALAKFIANSREDIPFLLSELPQTVAETIDWESAAIELQKLHQANFAAAAANYDVAGTERRTTADWLKSFVQRIHSPAAEMEDFPEAKELLIQKALRGLPKQVGNYPVEIMIRVLADEIRSGKGK